MKADLKSELTKIAKHAPVYSLGTILSQLAGFLLIPVYTRFLTTAEYGILHLVVLTSDIISIILAIKVSESIIRFYNEPEDLQERKVVVSTCLINVGSIAGLMLIPFILCGNLLAKYILADATLGYLIRISFVSMWFNLLVQISFAYIQIKEKSLLFIILSLTRLFVAISLNVYFVVIIKLGVLGIILSTLITAVLYTVITAPFLIREIGLKYSWLWTRKILRYALPFIPSTLANRSAHSSDRYFLRFYLSLSDVGIYSLGYRLGSLIHNIFNVSLFRILNVRIFAIHKAENSPEIIARIATYSTIFLIFIGLGLSLFAKDIVMIMTPEAYWSASQIIPAIVLCYIIFSSESFAVQALLISGKTERISYVNLIGGALNLVLNFILIPAFGIYGAVMSTFVGFVFKVTGIYLFGRKLFPIPFEWKRLLSIFVTAIVLFGVGRAVSDFNMHLRILANTILLLAFLPLLWVAGIFEDEEKTEIKKLFDAKIMASLKRA